MDASASRRVDADVNKVYGLFLQIENTSFSSSIQPNNTVIKYTKLPDFDFDSKVSWPEKSNRLQPRLRRIISLGDCDVLTSRSLEPALVAPLKTMSSTITRRKIVTIAEDDESDLHPKFSKERKSSRLEKTSNKSVETDYKSEKQFSQRTTSRLTNSTKYSKETKPSAKNNNLNNKKEVTPPKPSYRSKYSNLNLPSSDNVRMRNVKDKDLIRSKSGNPPMKISISKNFVTQRESEKELSSVKNKVSDPLKSNTAYKKTLDRPRLSKFSTQASRNSTPFLKEIQSKNKPVTIIHVPLDNYHEVEVKDGESQNSLVLPSIEDIKNKADCGTEVEKNLFTEHASTETKAVAETADKVTQSDCESEKMCKSVANANVQVDLVKEAFDSLHIPNVTLTKDRKESKESSVSFYSKSLPNLQVTSLKFSPQKDGYNTEDSDFYKSASYIIGHATVTCTTKQKINFHVVGNSAEETTSYQSPSPLAYPMSVVSIYEKEIKKKQVHGAYEQDQESKPQYTNCLNELKSLNCSYVLNSNKLVKPSDIISTIRVNNGLLHSEYICEQFERELNFIDSFFESLQYLENCSLSVKCFTENKGWIKTTEYDEKNSDYGRFLSKLENGANVDDTETMASKSLCLLNLLIRDEQRRAKNLLFVLKMREDALKDFTKSQILWLENKKKQDNTDISTLKKKQRGALLKLQHECGEMQRMRKALVTQSEKRKVVLMKTKKNIELKLKNSVDVDQILLGKKKLKRNTNDRNTAPLKCFDLLTSSGCDESSASRSKADIPLPDASATVTSVSSAEKCIQTGESILGSLLIDQSTDTAAENFVVVDGGYLNILFRNLSMPQIFSSGKNYEVNEEALRNILSSANTNHSINEADVLDRLMNQIKNPDLEISSPSTARSLVEEMDQYYKGLIDEEKSPLECSVRDLNISEVKDNVDQAVESRLKQVDSHSFQSASTMTSGGSEAVLDQCLWEAADEVECLSDKEGVVPQAGPLPVPAGEASSGAEAAASDVPLWALTKSPSSSTSECSSVSSQPLCQSASSLSSMTVPICEAEELRRQQLAIEREIKALEQQQCELLVVREIPDKPPPPYTPPVEARSPRPPRMYVADETTEEKIQRYVRDPESEDHDPTDAFDTFVKDFCIETIERQKSECTEMPWDSCNLLPQKPQEDAEKVIKNTSSHLLEILTGVAPTVVFGVSGRRSDHIDDILFAEWRRCEPEWTSLHSDESLVKNQIFESIFQKILTDTVDEYKRTVLCNK